MSHVSPQEAKAGQTKKKPIDKTVDAILAIYKKIDKGEIVDEAVAKKKLKRRLEKFEPDVRSSTLKSVDSLLTFFRKHTRDTK